MYIFIYSLQNVFFLQVFNLYAVNLTSIQLYNVTKNLKRIVTFRICVILFITCNIFFKQRKNTFSGEICCKMYIKVCLSTECLNLRKM